jgi:putative Mg2+ transporter-C (MgtC) family protein
VRGLTTAATLWLVAAIGMATGAGYWAGALITTFGALLILGPLRGVAFRILSRFRPALDRLLVEIPAGGSAVPVIDAIEQQGGRVISLEVTQEGDRRSVAVDVELATGSAPSVVAGVAEIDGVLEVRWME